MHNFDDAEFVTFYNIAIFDTLPANGEEFTIEQLKEIVKVNQIRERRTGDTAVITIGHTDDFNQETQQPPVVGFATNFRMGTKPDGIDAIFADFKIFREFVDQQTLPINKAFPRRSIELWSDGVIDVIAMLGATRPAKDLGLSFSKSDNKKRTLLRKYQQNILENNIMPETNFDLEAVAAAVFDKLTNSAEFQFIKTLMEESSEEKKEEMKAEEDEKEEIKAEDEEEKEEELKAEEDEEEKEVEAAKMNLLSEQVIKFKAEVESKNAEVEKYKEAFIRAEREKELTKLSYEYTFDVKDELDFVQGLDEDKYKAHLDRIKRNYHKAPIGVTLETTSLSDAGGKPVLTKSMLDDVVRYATKKKLSFDEAYKEVIGGK